MITALIVAATKTHITIRKKGENIEKAKVEQEVESKPEIKDKAFSHMLLDDISDLINNYP